jgi:hypothetical protein
MKLETPDVMAFLRGIVAEMRTKKLWPVAAALIAAIVAVPIALSKSSSSHTPVAQASPGTPPPANPIPALNVQSTPGQSKLTGHARNPFRQQGVTTSSSTTPAGSVTATSTATASSSATGNTPSTGGVSTSSVASSGSPSAGSPTTSTTPTVVIPKGNTKPAPPGLAANQAYDVAFAITNDSGGFDTTDPLVRLSVIPSQQQALLVELGVLKGGRRVLFAVQPGTIVNGPGTCTPGPIDCQILSLGANQTEVLSAQTPAGNTVQVADFAVTGISAKGYSSAAAAAQARSAASAAGRKLVNSSTLSALSLFQYEPSLGAVVDLRNLTVGGGS